MAPILMIPMIVDIDDKFINYIFFKYFFLDIGGSLFCLIFFIKFVFLLALYEMLYF